MLGVTEQLHLADIVGVHGVKGWVKIRAYVEDLKLLTQLSHVMVSPGGNTSSGESRAVQIVEVKPQGKGVIASLKGVNDRTMAETLRGWIIEIPATQLPPAEAGVFYLRDLVGLPLEAIGHGPVAVSKACLKGWTSFFRHVSGGK